METFNGKPWRGIVDVISGGFPCQDISVAGKGEGITGARSGLWKEMLRIVCEVDSRYVWVENASALTSRGLGTVLEDLAKVGYDANWGVLGGIHIGNVSNGERIWIFAAQANCPVLESLDIQKAFVACQEESCRRQFTRAVGAMLSQDDYTRIKRNPDEVARGMDRLKAIGNGQVPEVDKLAWKILNHIT